MEALTSDAFERDWRTQDGKKRPVANDFGGERWQTWLDEARSRYERWRSVTRSGTVADSGAACGDLLDSGGEGADDTRAGDSALELGLLREAAGSGGGSFSSESSSMILSTET